MKLSIKNWRTKNKINCISLEKIEYFIHQSNIEYTRFNEESIVKYCESDLNKIAIEMNLSCVIGYSLKKLYIMNIYIDEKKTEYVKIGSSSNPQTREKYLNSSWKGIASFKLNKMGAQRIDAYSLEKTIHKLLIMQNKQYLPKTKLNGYKEIFIYEEWMDNLIE